MNEDVRQTTIEQGRRARCRGYSRSYNPYRNTEDTSQFEWWQEGYNMADGDNFQGFFRTCERAPVALQDGDRIVLPGEATYEFENDDGEPRWKMVVDARSKFVPVNWPVLDWLLSHGAMIQRPKR